jgi:hypothetical protein
MKTIKQEIHFDVWRGLFFSAIRLFSKNVVNNSNSNDRQESGYLGIGDYSGKVDHSSVKVFSDLTAKYQNIIAAMAFLVNVKKSLVPSIATSQTTTRFAQMVENTLSWARVSSKLSLMGLNLSECKMAVNLMCLKNVPDQKFDDISSGWHEYYWEPMKEWFKKIHE